MRVMCAWIQPTRELKVSLSPAALGWLLKRALESKWYKQSDMHLLGKEMLLGI